MSGKWTREQTIVAFNVYCKIPFKDSRASHPLIARVAGLIGRSPAALNMKVGNFGRLDPALAARGVTGLMHGSGLEKEVWDEFAAHPGRLAYESERALARLSGQSVEERAEIDCGSLPSGAERAGVVMQRVNQRFFRQAVVSAYGGRCCVTGLSLPKLVEACHIVPWSEDEENRTNPRNGLCLNALLHRAYDDGLFSVSPDLRACVSGALLEAAADDTLRAHLRAVDGRAVRLPDRFLPSREFLEWRHSRFLGR